MVAKWREKKQEEYQLKAEYVAYKPGKIACSHRSTHAHIIMHMIDTFGFVCVNSKNYNYINDNYTSSKDQNYVHKFSV